MSLLGTDFNPARPTDGDFVRRATGVQMATEMRDLKSRISSFFDRKFDLSTGFLEDDVVPPSALQSLSPDPTGTYRTMEVNRKGQVIGGEPTRSYLYPRAMRACFFGDTSLRSFIDREDGVEEVAGSEKSTVAANLGYILVVTTARYLEWLFVVPDGVTRIGFGMSGGTPNPSDPTISRSGSLEVAGGDVLRVFASLDGVSPCRIANLSGTVYCDNTDLESGMTTASKTSASQIYHGFGGTSGDPSIVRLDWYA